MSESSALNLRAGDIVGGYTLVSRLGGGAMGSVWKIQDDGGNIYAMKILRDSLSDEQNAAQQDSQDDNLTARERLRREAMALQKIRHPGICNIVDMELDDAIAFIVTELIDGTTLREDVEKHGKYVGDDLERLTKKLVSAVQAVHNAGIIHRDIKPTNVMISAKGPVLVDFGIAMSEGESHVTRTGLVMGTPGFIAPEIINGSDSSEATDWWSLSSVLAFAATGKPVFGTKPMMAVLEREASGNAQLTGLPPHTMQAFRAALDPNTHKRISPQQLLEAISYDTWNNNFQKIDDEDHNQGEVMPPFRLNSQDDQDITNAPNSEHTQNVIPKTQVAQSLGNFQTTATVPNFIDTTASADNNTEELSGINNLETALMPSFAEAMQSDTRLLNTNPRKIWEDDLENENSNEYINHTTVFPNQYSPEPSTTALENNPQTSGMPTAARKLYPIQEQNIPGFEPNSVQAENSPNAPVLATPEEISQQYSAYAKRGTICQYALTPFIACLGAQYPTYALLCMFLLLWISYASGFNILTQKDRLQRNGVFKKTDKAIRMAALPWHIIKAGLLSILQTILASMACYAVMFIVISFFQLPSATIALPFFAFDLHIAVLYGSTHEAAGICLSIFFAAAWLCCIKIPLSLAMKYGAGWLVTPRQYFLHHHYSIARLYEVQSTKPSSNARFIIILLLWLIAFVMSLCNFIFFNTYMQWDPLPRIIT